MLNKAELPTSYVDSLASPRDSSSSSTPKSRFEFHFDGDEDKVDYGWQVRLLPANPPVSDQINFFLF